MTETPSTDPFVARPTVISSLLAVLAGIVAVGLIADTALQRELLAAAVVGVVSFGVGGRLWQRRRDAIGVIGMCCGGMILLVVVALTAIQPPQFIHRIELLPGILGIGVLTAALVPAWFRWSRLLVDSGTGLLFLAVLTSGVVRGASTTTLAIAAAATILAWDAAENAISLGGQVGAGADTRSSEAELVHMGFSGTVAAIVVAIVLGVASIGIDGLPFAALVALLVAGVALTLAYHR